MNERTFISIVVGLGAIYCYHCITVIPERAIVSYVNEKFVSQASVNVRRSSRRGLYVFNMNATTKITVGNNVTLALVIFEHNKKYNQYVRTLMEVKFKWCDLVLRDNWIGPMIRSHGVTQCPTPAGQSLSATNLSFTGTIPFKVMFEKGKIQASWVIGLTGEVLGTIDVFVKFLNK